MLLLLDIFFTIIHLAIIAFNLFGWIPKKTRKLHLISVLVTAACWFLLGLWYGIGYCPVTDWQWKVKAQLGESDIPDSFIEYFAEKISGYDFDTAFVNTVTAALFAVAVLASLFVNLIHFRKRRFAEGKSG